MNRGRTLRGGTLLTSRIPSTLKPGMPSSARSLIDPHELPPTMLPEAGQWGKHPINDTLNRRD